jgi:hypothetical protein
VQPGNRVDVVGADNQPTQQPEESMIVTLSIAAALVASVCLYLAADRTWEECRRPIAIRYAWCSGACAFGAVIMIVALATGGSVSAAPPSTLPDTTETPSSSVPEGADEPWPDSGTYWPDMPVRVDVDAECLAASGPEFCSPADAPLLAGCVVEPGEPVTWYTHTCPAASYRAWVEYIDSLIAPAVAVEPADRGELIHAGVVDDMTPTIGDPPGPVLEVVSTWVGERPAHVPPPGVAWSWQTWPELALWVDASGQAVGL